LMSPPCDSRSNELQMPAGFTQSIMRARPEVAEERLAENRASVAISHVRRRKAVCFPYDACLRQRHLVVS
jgi:hypothetical protein